MNASIKFFAGSLLTLALLITTTGCDRLTDVAPQPTATGAARIGDLVSKGFDASLFARKIETQLTGKVPGFGYRIIVNGQPYLNSPGGGGKARYSVDAPELAYTAATRQDIASSTKFVTALTVLRILERNKKDANELIWPYLPSYFKPHADFKKLRFIDVLSHTSGIVNYSNSGTQNGELNDVQDSVEDGIQLTEFTNQTYDYENMNYGLCRVLVPYMIGKLEQPGFLSLLYQMETEYAQLNAFQAATFLSYVQSVVMQPAGLVNWDKVDFKPWGSSVNQFTKFYPNNITNVSGNDDVANFLDSGAGGLVISAAELAQVVAAARAGKIVSANTLLLMKAGKANLYPLGFDGKIGGDHGSYFHKNGFTTNFSSVVMDFQGKAGSESSVNVQLVITANMGNSETNKPAVWSKLFDESWR